MATPAKKSQTMKVVSVRIPRDAYRRLLRVKRDDESPADAMARLIASAQKDSAE